MSGLNYWCGSVWSWWSAQLTMNFTKSFRLSECKREIITIPLVFTKIFFLFWNRLFRFYFLKPTFQILLLETDFLDLKNSYRSMELRTDLVANRWSSGSTVLQIYIIIHKKRYFSLQADRVLTSNRLIVPTFA